MKSPNKSPFGAQINSVLESIFGPKFWDHGFGPARPREPTPNIKIDYNGYNPSFILQALALYTQGIAIGDIASMMESSHEEINHLLDRYLPSLESCDP